MTRDKVTLFLSEPLSTGLKSAIPSLFPSLSLPMEKSTCGEIYSRERERNLIWKVRLIGEGRGRKKEKKEKRKGIVRVYGCRTTNSLHRPVNFVYCDTRIAVAKLHLFSPIATTVGSGPRSFRDEN